MEQTHSAVPHRPRVAILLFPDVEVLDWAGPYEVFAGAKDSNDRYCCQVITVAQQPEVQCYGGVRIKPEIRLELCPAVDALIVPGGPGARQPGNQTLLHFIREQQRQSKVVASVCTGSFLLARAGLLAGHKATTHHRRWAEFCAEFPQIELVSEKVVDEGAVITAGGISSGIDLALHLLERWFGPAVRQQEAKRLEGAWV